MQVNKTVNDIACLEAAQRAQQQSGANQASQGSVGAPDEVRRADEVQISDAGHAMSATAAPVADARVPALDARRMDEVRSNILSGAYSSLDMADHVARALMRSGDL